MRRDDICLYLNPDDRMQLQALVTDRNTPRKLAWRAEIVLATAAGCGTFEIMRRANTSKADGLALAGPLPRRGCRRAHARQDPAVAGTAAAPGDTPEGDRENGGRGQAQGRRKRQGACKVCQVSVR